MKPSGERLIVASIVALGALSFFAIRATRRPTVSDVAPAINILDAGFTSGRENAFHYRVPIGIKAGESAVEYYRTTIDTNVVWVVLEGSRTAWFFLECVFTNSEAKRIVQHFTETHQSYGGRHATRTVHVLPLVIPDPETIQDQTLSFVFRSRSKDSYPTNSLPPEGSAAFRLKIR